MPNLLYIDVSNGETITFHKISGEYENAQQLAEDLVQQWYPGESVLGWVLADSGPVEKFLKENGTRDTLPNGQTQVTPMEIKNLRVTKKRDMSTNQAFTRVGVDPNHLTDEDWVLHASARDRGSPP